MNAPARAPALAPVLACALACALAPGCPRTGASPVDAGAASDPTFDPAEPLLADLEKDEAAWRASTDWASFPASDAALGPDPFDIVALGDGRYAGVLRGADAVVLVSADGRELDRAPAPRAPRSLALHDDGEPGIALDIAGELDPRLWSVRVDPTQGIAAGGPGRYVPGAGGLRGVARGPRESLHLVDVNGRLVSSLLKASERDVAARDIGPFALAPRVARSVVGGVGGGAWLAVPSVQGHRVVVARVDQAGRLGAEHVVRVDGPVLGVALTVDPAGDALVAIGMIEDHPLDRTIGSFGFIDSFVRVVRVPAAGGEPMRVLEVNTSEHGVVTPKALAFAGTGTLLVAGAGSARAARIDLASGAVETFASLPGVVALVPTEHGFIGASPLLDAWVVVDAAGARAVPVPTTPIEGAHRPALYAAGTRSVDSRLGEALVFTTVMAPRQKSEGALSRFTCEACHFEGTVDGRTHDTGRMGGDDHVRATTKPLWGLFNNTPLFTRAMDPNLTRMAHAEFRVANSNSSLDPWFALTPADAPWLALLGVDGTRSPIELRRALVAFLRDFTPRTNPHVQARLGNFTGTKGFTDEERRGADAFRARCASCHAARLVGDDPPSEQPFERWEELVFSANGPLVWSSPEHKKTGVEPYVHEDGARASSLRRVWLKAPLFTTGAARTVAEALDQVRVEPGVADGAGVPPSILWHSSKRGAPLPDDEKRALAAFLRLL